MFPERTRRPIEAFAKGLPNLHAKGMLHTVYCNTSEVKMNKNNKRFKKQLTGLKLLEVIVLVYTKHKNKDTVISTCDVACF